MNEFLVYADLKVVCVSTAEIGGWGSYLRNVHTYTRYVYRRVSNVYMYPLDRVYVYNVILGDSTHKLSVISNMLFLMIVMTISAYSCLLNSLACFTIYIFSK